MDSRLASYLQRANEPPLPPNRVQEIFCEMMNKVADAFNGRWPGFSMTNGVNSCIIKSCLDTLKTYTFEPRMLWRTVYLLFLYFEERRDPKLSPIVAEVLSFIVYESYYAILIMQSLSPLRLERIQSLNRSCNIVLYLMRRPYSIPTYMTRPGMDIVWYSVMMDSEKLLPLLLRQGVVYIPPGSVVGGWHYYCVNVLKRICRLENIQQDFVPEDLTAVLETGIPAVRQRIFTVFRAMDVVQRKFESMIHLRRSLEGHVIRNYCERHRKVFDTIPEPIVTLQEVEHILDSVYDVAHAEAVDRFCAKFQLSMPESDTLITPRSLKHLSRYRVREVLRVNGMYPYGVYSLPVPRKVLNYILLKDPDDD